MLQINYFCQNETKMLKFMYRLKCPSILKTVLISIKFTADYKGQSRNKIEKKTLNTLLMRNS